MGIAGEAVGMGARPRRDDAAEGGARLSVKKLLVLAVEDLEQVLKVVPLRRRRVAHKVLGAAAHARREHLVDEVVQVLELLVLLVAVCLVSLLA